MSRALSVALEATVSGLGNSRFLLSVVLNDEGDLGYRQRGRRVFPWMVDRLHTLELEWRFGQGRASGRMAQGGRHTGMQAGGSGLL